MFDSFVNARVKTTVKHRVMVISAKGGVGKSTVTVNLAAALIVQGYKAGIFDADAYGPNIPALLGVRRKNTLKLHPRTMITLEARAGSPALLPVKPFERYGILLTSLGLLIGDQQVTAPDHATIGALLTFMMRQVDWLGSDILLIDMPPGTGEPLGSLLDTGVIDGVILVTTREGLAHQDNGRLLHLLRRNQVAVLGIVENMTQMICPHCGEPIELYPQPVTQMKEIYGDTPILASLPFDPGLIRRAGGGPPTPISSPQSSVSHLLLNLAEKVMRNFASP